MKREEKHDLLKYVGDLYSLFGMKQYTLADGRARGMRAIDLKNGKGIEMTVLPDRAMDIPYLSFHGISMHFTSKTGLVSPEYYVEDGARGFLKNFDAGLLTTCGITYSGAACEYKGRKLGLHGPLPNTPAENVNKWVDYEKDDVVLKLSGTMREACVFEENMQLHREMTLLTERNMLRIHDTVENCGFEEQPVMLVYHINFGYPMLDPCCRVYFNTTDVSPRTDYAKTGLDKYDVMEEPVVGQDEMCFIHTASGVKNRFAMLHNPKLGYAAVVHYDGDQCSSLCEWKCMRAGEYVLGLEPNTSMLQTRENGEKDGNLIKLKGGETYDVDVWVEFLDDQAEIQNYIDRSTNVGR